MHRYGIDAGQKADIRSMAYVQATVAFANYKANERIESLLLRNCHGAALTETQQLKNQQLVLLADNFRATGNDAELAEYIKVRDPKLILAGRIPELKPYTTQCP